MRKRLRNTVAVALPETSSTRDAVESSIELSKGDRFTTWEESAHKSLTKVARWEDAKKQPRQPPQPLP